MFEKRYSADKYEFRRTATDNGNVPVPPGDDWFLIDIASLVVGVATHAIGYSIYNWAREKR